MTHSCSQGGPVVGSTTKLSIESGANLRRKGNREVARQKGHTSFESHGRSD
jgi:hypothetical protein